MKAANKIIVKFCIWEKKRDFHGMNLEINRSTLISSSTKIVHASSSVKGV